MLCGVFDVVQGMTLEKKEARAEKEEAEKYQKFQQELVRFHSYL